jgi:starch phosphorylase
MMHHYFGEYCAEIGLDFERLMSLGRRNPSDRAEPFSMAIMALNTSAHRNAVSHLHRSVSQEMWHELWPQLPYWEIPITSVTNGVHLPSWINGDLSQLYDQYIAPDWRDRGNDQQIWELIREMPDEELFEAHRRRKRRLINFVRHRETEAAVRRQASAVEVRRAGEVLDPNALTIGFARRFATYKRATLIFKDLDRLKRILCNPERPVQLIFSGKAHPRDLPGKKLIRDVALWSRDAELGKHLVFLEDYDMKVAREMVQGVDLWLNNPRRGEEACGTSGMKAGINGVLNLSILDGWFDEAYEDSAGWAIGERETYTEDQDILHATAIYSLLENEIVPMFYERRDQGPPREWMRRVKQSMMRLSPRFDCRRMVADYMRHLYDPAHQAYWQLISNNFEDARRRADWNARIRAVWDKVRFVDVGAEQMGPVLSGRPVPVRAGVDLAGLHPEDVRVEVVVGRVGTSGALEDTQVMVLRPKEMNGAVAIYEREMIPERTGRLGYALRISPNHNEDPVTRPCSSPLKWG